LNCPQAIVRGYSWTSSHYLRNRRSGEAKLKIKEMEAGIFRLLYVGLRSIQPRRYRSDERSHPELHALRHPLAANRDYGSVWQILVKDFFQQFVQTADRVLDLGCGYGEFTKHIRCAAKFAMDLKSGRRRSRDGVTCHRMSARWQTSRRSECAGNRRIRNPDRAPVRGLDKLLEEIFDEIAN